MLYLKQSTAATVQIGPFVDPGDAVTAETGLTISQADVRLSKNGGDWAQKNDADACVHDEAGWYTCTLNTTDTNTLGRLQLAVAESGALPVWTEYTVLPAVVFDSLIAGSDYLQTDVIQVEGGDATAALTAAVPAASAIADAVWDEAAAGHTDAGKAGAQLWTDVDAILEDTAVIGAAGAGLTAVPWNAAWDAEVESEVDDALGAGTGTALTAIPWNAAWDAEVESEVDDALGAGTGTALTAIPWNAAWDAEVESEVDDALGAGTGTALTAIPWNAAWDAEIPTAAAISDAVWDEAATGHTDAGKAGAQLWTDIDAILEDTAAIPTPPTAGAIADQVWNEALAGHAGAGSTGAALDTASSGAAGAGAVAWTFTLTDAEDDPIAEVDVWATSDSDGTTVLASGETDSAGQVTLYLDTGTVYIWCQKAGYNFTNPTTVTVTA